MKKLLLLGLFSLITQLTFSQLKIETEVSEVYCGSKPQSTDVIFNLKCPSACSIIVGNWASNKWNFRKTVHSDSSGNAVYTASSLKFNKTFSYHFYKYPFKGKIDRYKIKDKDYKEKSVSVTKKCKQSN